MKNIGFSLKKIDKCRLLFYIMMASYCFFMNITFGDDVRYFAIQLDERDIISYLVMRYNSWTGRLMIEFLEVYLTRMTFLFKILNFLILVGIGEFSLKLIPQSSNKKFFEFLTLCLIVLYPFMDMSTAGWIATNINYTWTLCGLLYFFVILKKMYLNQKVNVFEHILSFISFLFAVNCDQLCAVSILLLIFITVLLKLEKKNIGYCVFYLLVNFVALIYLLMCPGNIERGTTEIYIMAFPEFSLYSFVNRAYLGFSETMNIVIENHNFIFVLFCLFTAIFAWKKNKGIIIRIISITPIAMICGFTYLKNLVILIWPNFGYVFVRAERINAGNAFNKSVYLPFMAQLIIILCLIIALNYIFDDLKDYLINLFVIGAGFLSRVSMGFIITFYESSTRTIIFFYAALVFSIVYMFFKNVNLLKEKEKNCYVIGISTITILTFINTLFAIVSKTKIL